MALSSLTVLFPSLNEERTLGRLVEDADRVASEISQDHEILVVDDGSTDETPALLERLKAAYPRLRWIRHPLARGPGAAVRSGLAAASKEWILTIDADGQFDLGEAGLLVAKASGGAEAVLGCRSIRTDSGFRRGLSGVYRVFIRRWIGIRMADPKCGFRLIRRDVLNSLTLRSYTGLYFVEMAKRLEQRGCRMACVPVHVRPRRHERSRVLTPRMLCRALAEHVRLWRDLKRA